VEEKNRDWLRRVFQDAASHFVGRELRKQFFDHRLSYELTLLRSNHGLAPRAEQAQGVPHKYLHLVGDHSAHPGTGKGPLWAS